CDAALPIARPRSRRTDRATQGHADDVVLGLFGVHERAELGELLAAQLVTLAALYARQQLSHERGELERIERLRHVVDAADVEPARAVPELCARRQKDDRDVG